jgi:predicted nucleic acid-binding protein
MSILADTNILLRRTQPDHPSHMLAVESVAQLLATGEPVYFTLQNMSEFWNVATRPAANNGLGFSIALALGEMENRAIPDGLAGFPDGLWGVEKPDS